MLLAGDEMGRSQAGNNNAYSQDNEVSWLDWAAIDWDRVTVTQTLTRLRQTHPVFRNADDPPEVLWFDPKDELTVAFYFDGSKCHPRDSSFLLVCNGRPEPRTITLPSELANRSWKLLIDTARTVEEVSGSLEIGGFGLVVARTAT
jgi:glycogen operon protein